MRCRRLITVLLAAVFLLGTVVPAIADNGRNRKTIEVVVKDHPWQDDCSSGGNKPTKVPLGFVIGPFTFTVNITIPFTQNLSQAPLKPANNTVTQKKVEKRK